MIQKLLILYFSVLIVSCSSIRDAFTFHPDIKTKIDEKKLPDYFKSIEIITGDDEKLKGFYLKHNDGESNQIVVYFHGNAGNLYHRLAWVNMLYLKGVDVLIFDYRGYGESTGSPTEEGIYEDGKSVLNYVKEELGYSSSQINLFGRSLGTTVVVENAQQDKFKSIILVTPFTTGKELGEVIAPSVSSVAMDSYDTRSKISNIQTKTMIIHGAKDRMMPITMAYELYHNLEVEKEFVTVVNGGHGNLQDVNPHLFWGSIFKFIGIEPKYQK